MVKICVADISAFLEPGTTRSTTAEFASFHGGAALEADGSDDRHHDPRPSA